MLLMIVKNAQSAITNRKKENKNTENLCNHNELNQISHDKNTMQALKSPLSSIFIYKCVSA